MNLIFTLILTMMTATNPDSQPEPVIPVYETFDELQAYLDAQQAPVLLVNFWATWCKPCVEEMPHIEELRAKYSREELAIVLVSLDFENQIETRVIPYLEREGIKSDVVLLADDKANDWIDRVSKEWSGAIPATVVKGEAKSDFYEGQFPSYDKLESFIKPHLKNNR